MNVEVPTPELDKRSKILDLSQTIGEFLDWLSENGMSIGHHVKIEGYYDEQYLPIHDSFEVLLARYFNIDLDKVEQERRAILEALRA